MMDRCQDKPFLFSRQMIWNFRIKMLVCGSLLILAMVGRWLEYQQSRQIKVLYERRQKMQEIQTILMDLRDTLVVQQEFYRRVGSTTRQLNEALRDASNAIQKRRVDSKR
jgi:hypothetical protein